jgi:hypothetical protein
MARRFFVKLPEGKNVFVSRLKALGVEGSAGEREFQKWLREDFKIENGVRWWLLRMLGFSRQACMEEFGWDGIGERPEGWEMKSVWDLETFRRGIRGMSESAKAEFAKMDDEGRVVADEADSAWGKGGNADAVPDGVNKEGENAGVLGKKGGKGGVALKVGRKRYLPNGIEMVSKKEFAGRKKVSFLQEIEWVRQNYMCEDMRKADAPTAWCWAMAQEMQKDPMALRAFQEIFVAKLNPTKKEQEEADGKRTDESEQVEYLMRLEAAYCEATGQKMEKEREVKVVVEEEGALSGDAG